LGFGLDAGPPWFEDGEATLKLISMDVDQVPHGGNQGVTSVPSEANQENAGAWCPTDECKPSEVLVLRQKHSPFGGCQCDYFAIESPVRFLRERANVMAHGPQHAYYGKVTALVSQEAHAFSPSWAGL
jgi:hypothetical protein